MADQTGIADDVVESRCRLRDKIHSLSLQKNDIEREIQSLSDILSTNDEVGLKGSLLDSEGFPRSDIDLVAVRMARNRIIRLNNDHRVVMTALEDALHQMHEILRQVGPNTGTDESVSFDHDAAPSIEPPQPVLVPFLLIDEVRPGSVAEQSGLEVNDLIAKFGSVTACNFSSLKDISAVLQNTPTQGAISLIVTKTSMESKTYHIELIKPSDASGIGLHVTPLSKTNTAES